ncbi:uncharacterized protein LOC130975491 [Arachis stenosperma]|uniref:uncharacterized protein LOC130975491 n=1 Tax=Arachis stenosperma TaxID=217475 RepID=UPI0025AD5873|nr:uncharacterized protein LOC130975491 [Arachis stenosperma]
MDRNTYAEQVSLSYNLLATIHLTQSQWNNHYCDYYSSGCLEAQLGVSGIIHYCCYYPGVTITDLEQAGQTTILATIQLTNEQKYVYDKVIDVVTKKKGGVFFLYGYGGTEKIFVWKTLASGLRSEKKIVLIVVSRGIVSLLLPGGRTTHSRLDKPFGGKTIVFGGDFRQILPVIPKGSRQDIVYATINSSYIWDSCKLLMLTKNMHLQAGGSNARSAKIKEFADLILSIGDGRCGTSLDGVDKVKISDDILINESDDPIFAICKATYLEMWERTNSDFQAEEHAILAHTLQLVDEINSYMMSLNPTKAQTYYSSDKACPIENNNDILASVHTHEFLNTIRCSGMPNHELTVKVGTPIILLRNIDHSVGLCNGTWLVVTKLSKHIIETKGISGKNAGQKVFIPRK